MIKEERDTPSTARKLVAEDKIRRIN